MPSSTEKSDLKLILLPGMDGTGDLFSEFEAALAGEFAIKVVRYPAKRVLSFSELELAAKAACLASGPFVMVAESFSTPLAIRCAASNPENLRGMVLCGGFASSPVKGWRRLCLEVLIPFIGLIPMPRVAARVWLVGLDAPASLVAMVLGAISSLGRKVLQARLREVLCCDVRAELRQVTVPVLYLQATRDQLVSRASVEDILRIVPQTQVIRLDGPHLLLQREPVLAADVVRDFARTFHSGDR